MHIKPVQDGISPRPRASLLTEAGLLCKSGLSSSGVAVFVNAIKARGVRFDALPVHVALRLALGCETRLKAVARLKSLALGTSGHILIADKTGGTSLEFSHLDVIPLEMVDGQIAHTNHFLVRHEPGVVDSGIFPDSLTRMNRIKVLLEQGCGQVEGGRSPVGWCERMLKDEDNFPTAVSRKSSPIRASETLYSIVTDLGADVAYVKLGRPNEPEGHWTLKPAE